jgi:predicted phage baseplate assembly protein
LTYLQSAGSTSGADYQSTLRISVDGIEWSEVPSFFGQPSDAQVFVTREDDDNVTHVQFGDGVNGARLSTGTDNVVATYRYGSGAQSPDAGALSSIVRPWPGLSAILNPVAAGGGADPDPPSQIRRYAPLSLTTFGRAISAADYTSIAAQAPGASRARSYFAWDPAQQRMMIRIYVGDDQNAVDSAKMAIAGASDPNRPVQVLPAQGIPILLSFSLLVDPRYQIDAVTAAVTSALIDPDEGLIGANVVQIGQNLWRSQVENACLSVPGAVAVHNLELSRKASLRRAVFRTIALPFFVRSPLPVSASPYPGVRFDIDEGGFFQLAASDLTITPEVADAAR